MSDDFYHDSDDASRVPKKLYMVTAKGRDPSTNRAKTWVRVHTSKPGAAATKKLWEKHQFLNVELSETETEWKEVA